MFRKRDGKRPSELPADLARLHRELRGIAIEERCSFGAELRAKLEEEHRRTANRMGRGVARRRLSGPRLAVVAVAGAFLLGCIGVAVPSARASLAKLLGRPHAAQAGADAPRSDVGRLVASDDPTEPASSVEDAVVPARPRQIDPPKVPMSVPASLPRILDVDAARSAVARQYPAYLQKGGIGGRVRVLAWVSSDGIADHLRISESSGVVALDEAARTAASAFRFRPAMHGAEPVGAWVEFSIRFRPSSVAEEQMDPESSALRIPLSN